MNQLYMVGSMGCASAFGLGIAIARPDMRSVIIGGDGAALMRLGNFATVGTYGGDNMLHILLDNEAHDSTGAQATVSANVKFADIAAACAYGVSMEGNDIELIEQPFPKTDAQGPRFAHMKIGTGTIDNLPRPDVTPNEVLTRLQTHLASV